jgi:penicillin-binding protein 1A
VASLVGRWARATPIPPAVWRWLALVAVLGTAFGGGLGFGSWTRACTAGRCPSIGVLTEYVPQQTSKVYAADGRLITELGITRRTVLPLAEIPPALRDAVIAVEDKRFFNHSGIDWIRFFGAARANLAQLRWAQGFSTITMQVARNVFPDRISREKVLTRKIKEGRVAIELEQTFDKDRILELYLNQIYLGSGAHGVEAAAQRYFGKSAREVNVAEAALVAALIQLPERYNPRLFPDRAVRRRNLVIRLMRDQGYLGRHEAEYWQAYPLELEAGVGIGATAAYFVEHVRQELERRFGPSRLYEEGLSIYTTLDPDLQEAAERSLEAQLTRVEEDSAVGGAYLGELTYQQYLERGLESGEAQGPFTPYLQGALVTIDASTGYVLALVGGRDFRDSKFNRASQAMRQAGSAFKPFVYSAAVRANRPLSYIVNDSAISMLQMDSTMWEPKNYDDTTFGRMPLRRSLYLSRNLSTIRLGMELGEQTVIGEVRKYGLTSRMRPYPSLHIGAADVTLLEMTAAFTSFANLGDRTSPIFVQRVEDRDGRILWEPSVRRDEVMDPLHMWLVVDMLRDVARRGTAAPALFRAGFTIPSGGKTGTTNDGWDTWYIGFTRELVTGIWVGFDERARISERAYGSTLAAPAWASFMSEVYQRRPSPEDWPQPEGLVIRGIDATTGYLHTPFCPGETFEFFVAGTEPTLYCPIHNPFAPGRVTP